MNTCLTCKYWEKFDERSGELPGIGLCKAIVDYWCVVELGTNNKCDSMVLKNQYTHKLALVRDSCDCSAYFYTFPTFGCVQYEPNPIENQN